MSDKGDEVQKKKELSEKIYKAATPAQKLATLDAGSDITIGLDNDRTIDIQKHLTSLATAFGTSEYEIANQTYTASKQLSDKGLSYSNIQLLRISDKDLDVYKQSGITYSEFLSLLVTMTTKNPTE